MVSMNMTPSALSDTAASQKLEDILQAKQDTMQALEERLEQLREVSLWISYCVITCARYCNAYLEVSKRSNSSQLVVYFRDVLYPAPL